MTDNSGIIKIDENAPVKAKRAATLQQTTRIARFKGSVIIEIDGKWHEMSSDLFAEACYRQFGFGINKSTIADGIREGIRAGRLTPEVGRACLEDYDRTSRGLSLAPPIPADTDPLPEPPEAA